MNKVPGMVTMSRCPCCGACAIEEVLRIETIEVPCDGESTVVEVPNVPVERCQACGEEFSGPRAAQVKHQAICRTLGLLTPDEIRKLRERMGLTQAQLSQISGIGEATISRWERGRLLQNRAMDRYLRLLASDAKSLAFLRGLDRGTSIEDGPPPSVDVTVKPGDCDVSDLERRFPHLGSDLGQCQSQAQRFALISPSFGGAARVA